MNNRIIYWMLISMIPATFAIVMLYLCYYLEVWDLMGVMSLAFLIGVPFCMGILAIYASSFGQSQQRSHAITAPWASLAVFLTITLAFSIEGWACWLMVFPLFMLATSLGGLFGRWMRGKAAKREKQYVSFILLLPLFFSPIEQAMGSIPGRYKAYTAIDINATKDRIWPLVTRVGAITADENKAGITRLLQFPQPIKAELDIEGKGGFRKAIFTGGLVFDETVTEYRHQEFMSFTISANPYDIPSTTMDEHIVIGGEFFDVLNGTYELEQLNDTTCRLHLYSHFKLSTTFNWYASIWAGWIMDDIQKNILRVIRRRAEQR